jgi:hypothetical protein
VSQFWEDKKERSEGNHRGPEQKEPPSERKYLPVLVKHQNGLYTIEEVKFYLDRWRPRLRAGTDFGVRLHSIEGYILKEENKCLQEKHSGK